MSRKKRFIKDIIVNMGAFGVYMLAYHVLMLPFLARVLPVELNAHFLLYLMLASIYTASFGNELGILFQVRMGREPKASVYNDVYLLMFQSNLLTLLLFIPLLLILKFGPLETLMLSLTTLVMNARLFYHAILRHRKRFLAIFVCNIGYLVGVGLSVVFVLKASKLFWLPLFLGEALSTLMTLFSDPDFRKKPAGRSPDFKAVRRESLDLIGASVLGNVPNYGDKILVLPLLGSLSMSAYYAGTSLSKALMLIVNPINGVLLSWLSTDTQSSKGSITRRLLRVNVLIVIGLLLVSFPVIIATTYLLYRQFYSEVIQIIAFLTISSAFVTSTTILKVVFLRYYKISAIKYINLLKIILFVTLSPIGARLGGLFGFSLAVAVSNIILWLIYYLSMFRKSRHLTEEADLPPGQQELGL